MAAVAADLTGCLCASVGRRMPCGRSMTTAVEFSVVALTLWDPDARGLIATDAGVLSICVVLLPLSCCACASVCCVVATRRPAAGCVPCAQQRAPHALHGHGPAGG